MQVVRGSFVLSVPFLILTNVESKNTPFFNIGTNGQCALGIFYLLIEEKS